MKNKNKKKKTKIKLRPPRSNNGSQREFSSYTMIDFFKIPGFEKVPCGDMNFH